MPNGGYVWLWRSSFDCWQFHHPPYWVLWTYLIMKAAHCSVKVTFQGREWNLARGELITSAAQMSRDTGIHRRTCERLVERCTKSGDIRVREAGRHGTHLSICKYDSYQAPAQGVRGESGEKSGEKAGRCRGIEQEPKKQRSKTTTSSGLPDEAREILVFMNEKAGRNYQPVPANLNLIRARLKEGATVEDCKTVIAIQVREWKDDPKWSKYLRPATIFNATKFWQYHGKIGTF